MHPSAAVDALQVAPYNTRPLGRSDSMTSVESDGNDAAPRRTRKRFNSVQLMMLENLFHHNSHPSRQERETLATAGQMEIKSVTIWFQNKRQTERRGAQNALNNSTNRGSRHILHSDPFAPSTISSRNQGVFRSVSFSSLSMRSKNTTTTHTRPSLDRVASLSELPEAPQSHIPRTPTRLTRTRSVGSDDTIMDEDNSFSTTTTAVSSTTFDDFSRSSIWESMPSSPPIPLTSPPARDFVEFGKLKRSRTLEWACARQRLAGKESGGKGWDDEDLEMMELPPLNERPFKKSKSHHNLYHHSHHHHHSSAHRSSSSSSKSKSSTNKSTSTSKPSGASKSSSSRHHHRSTAVSASASASAVASSKHKSKFSRPRLHRSVSEGDDAKKALERVFLGSQRSASRASSTGSAVSVMSNSSASTSSSTTISAFAPNHLSIAHEGGSPGGGGGRISAEDDDMMRAALALCGLGGRG
ncbi:hypothetical protein K435DRAFT_796532 [Dendrothele bispora CBS 962.96]|uniref:Homeobox domain-containing protein n=1 Tax=Dendrothele bispora (strain CBS 962.96) TaxID=1314807 RepID=A0A4S8M5A8_DENBC|nr:hypothetical protein K435DRAFT_796532 [Dendrothele bispora CBS 962.96]